MDGSVQPNGSVSASGQGQRRDRPYEWNAQFTGRASATAIRLVGTRDRGRPCAIELTNMQPAPYSQAGIQIAQQQQAARQAEQLAEAEREQAKAVERQKSAQAAASQRSPETAPRQAGPAQNTDTEHQRLMAEVEAANKKAAEAEQQVADLRAAQEGLAKEQAAQAQRQQAETEQLRKDAQQLAASQAAQDKETSQSIDTVTAFLNKMPLPKSERLADWIAIHPSIPVQQQQFCEIIKKFGHDLTSVEDTRNEVRRNVLYRNRQLDMEALLQHGRFDNWIVHVIDVTQAADGSAAIRLQPPCDVMFGSDACQKDVSKIRATIKPDTPLFREVQKLAHDDFVVVSGTILYAANDHSNSDEPLPQFAWYKPGEYCPEKNDNRDEDTFVTNIDYLVQLH